MIPGITPTTGLIIIFAGLVGGILWNLLTWLFGIPSSSSHALFGGLIGAGLAALAAAPRVAAEAEVVHVEGVVLGTDKPSQAIRRAKSTSMGLAIESVKAGQAQAAVSAGNTGALMAMAKLSLRTLPGIDRPALAAPLPTLGDNDVVVLDLGANTECDARNLVQFAVMGAAYARTTLDLSAPRVALLNIGTEDMKGIDSVRDAAAAIRAGFNIIVAGDAAAGKTTLSRAILNALPRVLGR